MSNTTLREQIDLMKLRRKARFAAVLQQAHDRVQSVILGHPTDVMVKDIHLEGSTIKATFLDADFVPFTIQFYGEGLTNVGGDFTVNWQRHTPESFWIDEAVIAGIARQLGE